MDTARSASPDESQDDPFDLDVRVYPVVDENDNEALASTVPGGSSGGGCAHTSGCW